MNTHNSCMKMLDSLVWPAPPLVLLVAVVAHPLLCCIPDTLPESTGRKQLLDHNRLHNLLHLKRTNQVNYLKVSMVAS